MAAVLADLATGQDLDLALAALARAFQLPLRLDVEGRCYLAPLGRSDLSQEPACWQPVAQDHGARLSALRDADHAWGDFHQMAGLFLRAAQGRHRAAVSDQLPHLLHDALQTLPYGVLLFDAKDHLVFANQAAQHIYPNLRGGGLLGYSYETLLEAMLARGAFPQAKGQENAFRDMMLRAHHKPSANFTFEGPEGRVIQALDRTTLDGGRVSLRTDITAAREAERRLSSFIEGAQAGTWEWNLTTGALEIDDRWAEMLGYSRAELDLVSLDVLINLIHPEDRPACLRAFRKVRLGWAHSYDVLCRMRHKQGPWVWVQSRGRVSRNTDHGAPSWVAGVHLDVSALKAAEERLEQIIEAASVGTWNHDFVADRISLNDMGRKILGLTHEDMKEMTTARWWGLAHPDDRPRLHRQVPPRDQMGRRSYVAEYRYRHRDGHWVWLMVRGQALRWTEAGEVEEASGVMLDISAAAQAEVELQEALKRAEAANFAKSQFLTNMSHELRTPLGGVIGMADLLAQTSLSTEQRNMVATIRASGRHLLSLVNDILDLAKVESGTLELRTAPLQLDQLVAEVAESHRLEALRKGLRLSLDLGAGAELQRLGDGLRLAQILHNLLGNAVKFTQTGGITVSLRALPYPSEGVHIEVRDTGIGMSPAQVEVVFEQFTQADAGIARNFGGTGLGLAISRRLVRQMGGEITLTSRLGQGSLVSLRLPLPAVVSPVPRLQTPILPKLAHTTGLRVLVADDNATNRMIMRAMLTKLDADATLAVDGTQAIALFGTGVFDLVLLDIAMPGKDGLATLRELRQSVPDLGLLPPIWAATANAHPQQQRDYLAAGFDAVLSKPFSFDDFAAALAALPRGPKAGSKLR